MITIYHRTCRGCWANQGLHTIPSRCTAGQVAMDRRHGLGSDKMARCQVSNGCMWFILFRIFSITIISKVGPWCRSITERSLYLPESNRWSCSLGFSSCFGPYERSSHRSRRRTDSARQTRKSDWYFVTKNRSFQLNNIVVLQESLLIMQWISSRFHPGVKGKFQSFSTWPLSKLFHMVSLQYMTPIQRWNTSISSESICNNFFTLQYVCLNRIQGRWQRQATCKKYYVLQEWP